MYSFSSGACKRGAIIVAFALAQSLAMVPLAVQAEDGSVRIAGQTVFSTKVGSGGMTAEARAEAIQKNLDNALVAAKDRTPSSVNIVYVKGLPVITLGGYQVATVNSEDAKAAGTSPALLAQRWADSLRGTLQDQSSIGSYVAQLSGGYAATAPAPTAPAPNAGSNVAYTPPPGGGGYGGNNGGYGAPDQFNRQTPPPQYGGGAYGGGQPPQYGGGYGGGAPAYGGGGGYPMQRGYVMQAGVVLPVQLKTSISTQAAQPGDLLEASMTDPTGQLPAGTVLVGQVTDAKAGGFMGRSGMLGVKFTSMRTPDGQQVPISAHVVGGIGKYADADGDGVVKGETWKTKVGQAALRGAIGAGTGAALGTAVGAIAGRGGRGAGRGAWSGTAIGGGLGVADSLLLRKGKDVTIKSGTAMQVQLDAPVSLSGGGVPPYSGAF